uniref:UDP-2,4-diacetamido-2,4, 6-trideoxy-beta-L-altropyranose hydrolase n=2 Tax=Brevundimonas basaltis TaxID=472166 RepID=A0A7W8HZ95_9CAUL|nr:UDP-2,4-diacetamido-2,4,6-trideoxy-beta-L-altropyranose hydrolase [Brevundimonas basaltis]
MGADAKFVARRHDRVSEIAFGEQAHSTSWLDRPRSEESVEHSPSASPHAHWAGTSWEVDADETIRALRDFRPDWLVVDHYSFDARWHDRVRRELDCKVAAIDDLADRPLSVEVLVDANLAESGKEKYSDWLTGKCRVLSGPRYALLAADYRTAPRHQFHPEVRSIGIFMGGTDPGGISADVLQVCRNDAGFGGPIEVVSISANPHLAALRQACIASPNTTLSLDLQNLSAFYARHDLHVGAGGTATYERCCMGAPAIALAVAPNQLAVIPKLTALGIHREARLTGKPVTSLLESAPELADVVRDLVADPAARQTLSELGMSMVDARGADRVAACLLGESLTLRPAKLADGDQLHAWRNHPTVRALSNNDGLIDFTSHIDWLKRKIAADDCWIFVAMLGEVAAGCIRFDQQGNGDAEVSLYLDPDCTGLGLGPHLLLAGERAVIAERPSLKRFTASVLRENKASARLFINCGYSGGPLRYDKPIHQRNSGS